MNDRTKWHADGGRVYDEYNNMVCECYQLHWVDRERGVNWAKHNASEIVFLHNDRLARDKFIARVARLWEGDKQTRKEKDE